MSVSLAENTEPLMENTPAKNTGPNSFSEQLRAHIKTHMEETGESLHMIAKNAGFVRIRLYEFMEGTIDLPKANVTNRLVEYLGLELRKVKRRSKSAKRQP